MPRSSKRPAEDRPPDGPGALALHRAALDAMAHGLCVFDAEWRIALFNRRYLEIFNLSSEVIRPGLSYRDMLAHSCERGNLAPGAVEAFWGKRRKLLERGAPFTWCRELPSGIIVSMRYEPLPDGGWVSVYEDVTAQHHLEAQLRVQVERLDRAVSNMSHGLSLFGPDERLVICNEQYVRIYGLDPAVAKPGISYRDLLAHAIALGRHGDMTLDELYAERMDRIRHRVALNQRQIYDSLLRFNRAKRCRFRVYLGDVFIYFDDLVGCADSQRYFLLRSLVYLKHDPILNVFPKSFLLDRKPVISHRNQSD